MEGDKLLIKPGHTHIAACVAEAVTSFIARVGKYTLSVAGESGAGKSEIAAEIARMLTEWGLPTGVLQMDDYFVFPPRTNTEMRRRNIDQVGMYEAKLDFLASNLRGFKRGDPDVYKPLSIYDEDRLTTEVKPVGDLRVLIAEGTYTTALEFVDTHIFIDRNYHDTLADRRARGRDVIDAFTADILEREHRIIRTHKARAEIIVRGDFSGLDYPAES